MKQKTSLLLLTAALCAASILGVSHALAAPEASAAKEVVDYFYNGQEEGPILVDAKLCKTVEKLDCADVLDPAAVAKGESVKVWSQFFVPKDGIYDDIFVEYKLEGMPRRLNARKVEGSIRYRLVDTYKPDKVGQWKITIKRGLTDLKTFELEVTE
ncbi:MAG: hypothetical protein QNI92_18355 [Desulfobacterales bacterium]|nr:hypothetical protein [Desulfobacterales bacterium]